MKSEMRSLLVGKRSEFLSQLQAAQVACFQAQTPGFTIRTHPADREDNPEIFSVNFVRVNSLREYLTKVDRALEKLGNGEYGYCEGCGKKIPLKRLKVLPFAELCMDCKAQAEKK